ncbi:MAG: hypothetical protein HY791_24160 [Deltaproteobacteria bacterium]|nr:hypothetical protein [Deltaproteobacteria bacterium]
MRRAWLALIMVSCSESSIQPPDAAMPYRTYWQDIDPILEARCRLCHQDPPLYGAPRPLMTYAQTQALYGAEPIHVLMARRVTARQNAMPPPSQPQLSEDEKQMFVAWTYHGAPEGSRPDAGIPSPSDAGIELDATATGTVAPDAGLPTEGLDAGESEDGSTPDASQSSPFRTMDILAHANGSTDPYPLPVEHTNYRCWSYTVPPGSTDHSFVVRIEPIIDNPRHLHHILLFRVRSGNAEDGPFSCGGLPVTWDMVAGWAPGRTETVLPPGTGFRAFAGDRYVVQAHYDSVAAPGQFDRSGMRIHISDDPSLTEAGVLWHGTSWLTPLHGSSVSKRWMCQVRRDFSIYEIFPHMHQSGLRILLELQRDGDSTWNVVSDIPTWSFDDQPNVLVPAAYRELHPGDRLRTTCWWDTMGRSVSFGEASDDEMCFHFITHAPIIPNPNTACVGVVP